MASLVDLVHKDPPAPQVGVQKALMQYTFGISRYYFSQNAPYLTRKGEVSRVFRAFKFWTKFSCLSFVLCSKSCYIRPRYVASVEYDVMAWEHILMSQHGNIGWYLNPLCANFFRGCINIYLHFMSLLQTNMTQVLTILPQVRPGLAYST